MNTDLKISPNFYYSEFFPRGLWERYDAEFLKKLLDNRLVDIMELLRNDISEPIYINNWKWGGDKMYRAFRPMSSPEGSIYSQHKFGRGVDFNVSNQSPNQVRDFIMNNESKYLNSGLTRMEDARDAPKWVHLDLAWTGLNNIKIFRA